MLERVATMPRISAMGYFLALSISVSMCGDAESGLVALEHVCSNSRSAAQPMCEELKTTTAIWRDSLVMQ